jgi:calcium-dependent protein kinase
MNEKKGTPHYMAPEVINQNYTQKCDIWSCGVILYMLLSGGLPFHGGQDEEIMNSIKIGKYNFNARIWSKISNDAKRLIQRMLEYNPDRRCSAQEALDDPWFKKVIEKEEVDNSILSQYLQNLKNFKFESKLQETTWRFLVFYFSTKEEKEKLLKTFKTLDVDSNGQLTKEELKQGFIKVMGLSNEQAEEEACRILKIVDTNNSGSIDYSEFVNATISKSDLLTKERLEAAFKVLDKNGDGKISANEIRLLFNEEKTHDLPQLIWRYWISEVDKNLDGTISLEEFKEMMVSLMSKC